MPDFTIEGSPGGIRARANLGREKGRSFIAIADALTRISTDGWTGRAAEKFRDALDDEPQRWRESGDGFVRAAAAFDAYADALERAQSQATTAAAEHERGNRVTEHARTAHEAERRRLEAQAASPSLGGGILLLTPFHDPGEAVRDAAVAALDGARADLEAAAHRCAGEVRAACTAAPAKRNWLESGLAFVGGIFEGAGEAVWDLLTISPVSPINLVRDLYNLTTGELTLEELAMQHQMAVEDVGAMLQALRDDPVTFGKELGKGLLDWDTWTDDPARAIGHLVPDAVAAVLTAGTGALATRGIKGGVDALDALSDIASGANRLDDLATGANRLDDLATGANRLDDLPGTGPGGRTPDLPPFSRMDEFADLPHRDLTSGEKGGWNRELNNPEPDTVYTVDGRHQYVTDGDGRVSHVESQLEYQPKDIADLNRNEYQQRVAGREFRLETDQGGHLVGSSLGGPGEAINLVPMDRALNAGGPGSYGALEESWRGILRDRPDADIRVTIDVDYPPGSSRPEGFTVEYSVDGGPTITKEFEQ